jgi:hypothetical protein
MNEPANQAPRWAPTYDEALGLLRKAYEVATDLPPGDDAAARLRALALTSLQQAELWLLSYAASRGAKATLGGGK